MLPYVILIRINSLLAPNSYIVSETDSIITKTIFSFVSSPIAQSIVAMLLVYLQAVYINRIVIKNRLAPEITLVPGVVYSVLMSLFPENLGLTPQLINNTFILLALSQIFKTYKSPSAADRLFNVGFWIGVSTLISPNYVYLMLIGVLSIFVLRSSKLREFVHLFSGLVLVSFLFIGILYLKDLSWTDEISKLNFPGHLSIFNVDRVSLYKFVFLILLAVFSVFNYNNYSIKKSIQAQKKIDILFWLLLGSFVMLFIDNQIASENALLLFIPLAIFYNSNLLNIKSPMIQELVHIGALGLLFALNFGLI